MAGKTRIFLALGSAATAATYLGYTGNEWFYKHVLMKCVQRVDAEKAHVMGVKLASMGLLPKGKETAADRSLLVISVVLLSLLLLSFSSWGALCPLFYYPKRARPPSHFCGQC